MEVSPNCASLDGQVFLGRIEVAHDSEVGKGHGMGRILEGEAVDFHLVSRISPNRESLPVRA